MLCTGRSFTETRRIVDEIGLDLDAAISVFGALVTEVATGRTIDRTPIPLDTALDVTNWFQKEGYAVSWLTDADEAGNDGYVIDGPRRHEALDRWIERSACDVRCTDRVPADAIAPLRLSIIDEVGVLEEVSPRLRHKFDGRLTHNILDVPAHGFTVIEAFAAQVNKWFGIEKLCRMWRIDPRRTAAIGDDVNDLDMLREAGLGVAVGNARPAVKDVARRIVARNDECGVAELIDMILDGTEEPELA